ncbi:hypothetical protein, partial [Burkholderia diffusa]|uniref:hypothetical protein n=1 Tax=Burkholderia diffusa TaxID=488732 RepID=UPI001E2FF149
ECRQSNVSGCCSSGIPRSLSIIPNPSPAYSLQSPIAETTWAALAKPTIEALFHPMSVTMFEARVFEARVSLACDWRVSW